MTTEGAREAELRKLAKSQGFSLVKTLEPKGYLLVGRFEGVGTLEFRKRDLDEVEHHLRAKNLTEALRL